MIALLFAAVMAATASSGFCPLYLLAGRLRGAGSWPEPGRDGEVPAIAVAVGVLRRPYAAAAAVRRKVVPTLFWMKAPGRRRAIACVAFQPVQ